MGDSFEAFVDSETVKFIGNQKIVQSGLGIYDEAHKSDKFLVKSAVKMTDLTLACSKSFLRWGFTTFTSPKTITSVDKRVSALAQGSATTAASVSNAVKQTVTELKKDPTNFTLSIVDKTIDRVLPSLEDEEEKVEEQPEKKSEETTKGAKSSNDNTAVIEKKVSLGQVYSKASARISTRLSRALKFLQQRFPSFFAAFDFVMERQKATQSFVVNKKLELDGFYKDKKAATQNYLSSKRKELDQVIEKSSKLASELKTEYSSKVVERLQLIRSKIPSIEKKEVVALISSNILSVHDSLLRVHAILKEDERVQKVVEYVPSDVAQRVSTIVSSMDKKLVETIENLSLKDSRLEKEQEVAKEHDASFQFSAVDKEPEQNNNNDSFEASATEDVSNVSGTLDDDEDEEE